MRTELADLQEDNPMFNRENRAVQEEPDKGLQMRAEEERHTPNLLSRITCPTNLQGLPLQQAKGSIRTYSSNATISSKDTARGRSKRRPFMSTSSQSFSKLLERIESDPMQPSNLSLPPSKVTTLSSKWQQEGQQRPERDSAPPSLLYRMQMDNVRMMSLSPKSPCPMNQSMLGLQEERVRPYRYQKASPRPSNFWTSTRSTQRLRRGHSLTNPTVRSFRTLNGRVSSREERSTSMQYLPGNSPQPTTTLRPRTW